MSSLLHDSLTVLSWSSQKMEGFLEQGGTVLFVIMFVTFFLWMLIIERLHYFYFTHQGLCDAVVRNWMQRKERVSWCADKIRLRLLSLVRIRAQRRLSSIKLVVVVAPLLGLLGTVTGMIDVFDVMATTGASNARAMAAGVSKATIPTMAGMVISLSGLLFSVLLRRKAATSMAELASRLIKEDTP